MDSSGSGSETNGNDGALSSSPGASSLRERTDSESSDKQTRFILPSADGSPPKVLTMDEVVDVVKNIQNMTLVHEIALNPEFKLKPYEPPEDSLERRIRDVMHKAFWDVLREQLSQDPPCFNHAIQLLADIKECFPQIIPANNKRLLDHINEVLDVTVIQQQAEQGVLDFNSYANFVIGIMAKSCAPIRDEEIRKLQEIDDVVDTFRGILETMTVMKLDMANCLLEFARNDLVANSVEYEKEKFKEYLEYYKFGFPATENWLKRSQSQSQDSNGVVSTPDQVIFNAYMDLLDWNEADEFPEILSIDKDRILKLSSRALRLCAAACTIAISSSIPIISQRTENRVALAQEIEVLLQSVANNSDLENTMENVSLHVQTVIKSRLQEENSPPLDAVIENTLKSQILQIGKKDSPVRSLMWKRLQTYFRLVLRSKSGMPPPPPGYVDFKGELETLATAFKRLLTYNYSVFGEYYVKVLTDSEHKNDEKPTDNSTTATVDKDQAGESPKTSPTDDTIAANGPDTNTST
ncbi:T-complex protein 11-like protein 1 isoform X2 [Hermetia illucens]|nr:T-complex protein 11-like protein 1 isoform X2 [Hermetia illucens]XP_037920174.1 T-complex protein 11-like protein 1 isoform X2 [Hermetia illucens]